MLSKEDLAAIQEMFAMAEEKITQQTMIMMESKFQPQFDLLAENQQTILDKVAPRSRVEELEDKVNFLESIVRRISKDLEDMKKAN